MLKVGDFDGRGRYYCTDHCEYYGLEPDNKKCSFNCPDKFVVIHKEQNNFTCMESCPGEENIVYHEENHICMRLSDCLFQEKVNDTTYLCKNQCGANQFIQVNGREHICVEHCPPTAPFYTKSRKCVA